MRTPSRLVFALLGYCLVAFPATATTEYSVSRLGYAGNDFRSPYANPASGYGLGPWRITADGAVVGGAYLTDGMHAFVARNGFVHDLGSSPGGFATAWSVNSAGQAVGEYVNAQGNSLAVRYSGSAAVSLGTLGGPQSAAIDINDAGTIVGAADVDSSHTLPFILDSAGMHAIGSLGGNIGQAFSINRRGDVVGASDLAGDETAHAFLFSAGTLHDLGTTGGTYSLAARINDSGLIGGVADTPDGAHLHAMLDDGLKMLDIGTLYGNAGESFVAGLNNSGVAVGGSYTSAIGSGRGFIYRGGTMTNLNALIDPASGWLIQEARDINDAGQIVAIAYDRQLGQQFNVLLNPVPEPATWALMFGGLFALGAAAKRGQARL